MKKKKTIALILSVILLLPTAAYAKGNNQKSGNDKTEVTSTERPSESKNTTVTSATKPAETEKKDNAKAQEKKSENEAKKQDKKTQIEDFKASMKVKHETMKELKTKTIEVKKQVVAKKTELRAILEDIKSGKKVLPQDLLDALIAKADNLKLHSEEVKASGDINKEVVDTQEKVKKQDFNNALASMDKVIAKLQTRLTALENLNKDLDDTLVIARQAVASVDETKTTTPTGETTNSTTETVDNSSK